jgi:prephenate dehydrogenase
MMVVFVVAADGSVTVSQQEQHPDPPRRESRLPLILETIADPNSPVAEIMRLICEELVLVIQEMVAYEHDKSAAPKLKVQVAALCALLKLVQKADASSKKDVLNFDGPKFQFVLGRLIKLFKEATEKALGKGYETSAQSILKHFRDLVAVNEELLRGETERIGAEGVH